MDEEGNIPTALKLRIGALRQSGMDETQIRRQLSGGDKPPPATAEAPRSDPPNNEPPRKELTLTHEAARLFSHFYLDLGDDGAGAAVEFISPHRGEGTSSVAREFACTAALHSNRPILLLDLDFRSDAQYNFFASSKRRYVWGEAMPGPAEAIGIDFAPLLRLGETVPGIAPGDTLITTHRIGNTSLFVTRLNPLLRERQISPHITTSPDFWQELRRICPLTVIDAPPVHVSSDGLALCRLVDQVVIVVEAETTRIPVIQELCSRLAELDARIAGIVLNKRNFYIPHFLYRWI